MNASLPVAIMFGIEIRVSASLAILLGMVMLIGAEQAVVMAPDLAMPLQWLVGALVAVAFLVTVLGHELAHALVGRRRGVTTTTVVLNMIGGMAPVSIEAARPRDELAIALAGPFTSLIVAAVALPAGYLLGDVTSPVGPIAGGLFVVGSLNLLLGLVSLLPGMPLDGGRAVRALAWARTGDRDRAARATERSGRLLGFGVAGVGIACILVADPFVGLMLVALGWLLAGASRSLEQRRQIERALQGAVAADALVVDVARVGPQLTVDTFADRLEGDGAVRALPVVDGDRVVGVVGAGRLRRLGRRRYAATRAGEVMAVPPQAPLLAPGESLWKTMELLGRGLDGLAVVEGGVLLGVVTRDSVSEAVRTRIPEWMLAPRRRRWL
jgi:Zn-dependent protease/CBS domain-containing protein